MVPFTLVSITVVNELPGAVKTVQTGIAGIKKSWDASASGGGWLAFLREQWQLDHLLTPEKLDDYTTRAANTLINMAFPVVSGVVGFLVSFVFLVFVLFFLFRDG